MKVSFVSSSAVSDALRASLLKMQAELVKGQKEQATLKHADIGVTLGADTARSVTFKRDIERLGTMIDANGLAKERLATTQDTLSRMSDLASEFLSTLTAGASGSVSNALMKSSAEGTLSALQSLLQTTVNGEHIFAGINTDVAPLKAYGAGSPAKAAFDASFLAHFGFAQSSPAAQSITPANMQAFLDNGVEPQFLGAGWQANWSNATDQPITSRIALNETAETSVSANTPGVRRLAMAASMVSELLSGQVGGAGRDAMLAKAVDLVGKAITDIAGTASQAGLVQSRIEAANERLSMQVDIFTKGVDDLEAVDPYEVATRLSALKTQIESSYALTARIHELSLTRYLS